uniref:Uncharacterized protein n=1 Tax=Phasianus colchicus TaxID=9054 RepID=A0A669QJ67_PHACC
MDRFEDSSDGEVDHTFYESDFGEEEKKTEENGEYIEKGSTKVRLIAFWRRGSSVILQRRLRGDLITFINI